MKKQNKEKDNNRISNCDVVGKVYEELTQKHPNLAHPVYKNMIESFVKQYGKAPESVKQTVRQIYKNIDKNKSKDEIARDIITIYKLLGYKVTKSRQPGISYDI